MRVKNVRKKLLSSPKIVYDVYNALPHNNFMVKAGNEFVVSHNSGILDEVEFMPGANINMQKAKVMNIYRQIKRRMESRFAKLGELPGILFLISSKRTEHDFLEQYIQTVKDNPHVYVVDEPLWKIKPASNYSGKTFKVAVGNRNVKSKIVGISEDADSFIEQGYQVLDVPVEHREAFELDVDSALQDIGGISSTTTTKFFSYSQIQKCYSENKINPFRANILTVGLHDNLTISEFFLPDIISDNIKSAYNFVHIDTSWKADLTGVTMVSVGKPKTVSKYVQGKLTEEIDATYSQVFSVGIKAPSNSEISFAKTRDFIYYLRDTGFNITGISADGFQSIDTLQTLTQAGFSTDLISVDRKPDPYLALRTAIAEERISLLNVEELETELLDLQRDNITGKIDHPEGSSKDFADSLCGAFYYATRFKMLPYLKHAASDSETAINMFSEDYDKAQKEEKGLLGIDPETKVVRKIGDLSGFSDDDIVDW